MQPTLCAAKYDKKTLPYSGRATVRPFCRSTKGQFLSEINRAFWIALLESVHKETVN